MRKIQFALASLKKTLIFLILCSRYFYSIEFGRILDTLKAHDDAGEQALHNNIYLVQYFQLPEFVGER